MKKGQQKFLCFTFRGQFYTVDKKGRILANNLKEFSDTWIFLGGSHHHWSRHIDVTLEDAFKNPRLLQDCLGWDLDHGTVRQWSDSYYGKLPRICNPQIVYA